MATTFLGQIYRLLYDDEERINNESDYLWRLLFERIDQYANPAFDAEDVSSHFFKILRPLYRAVEIEGFKRGVSLAMRLAVETLYTPEKSKDEIEREYESLKSAGPLSQVPPEEK